MGAESRPSPGFSAPPLVLSTPQALFPSPRPSCATPTLRSAQPPRAQLSSWSILLTLPPGCMPDGEAPPPPAPQPYRSQGPGMWDGCAKPVPRSSPRAPTPEAAAPLRSRAASAGSAETTGGQRAETRLLPGGRPAGRGGRRGRGPSRPRAPEPSSPPPRPARGVKRSGARGGRSFPRTGLPGKHWRSLFLER